MKNIAWNEREFILTLYIYRTYDFNKLGKNSKLICEFTEQLNLVVGNNRTNDSISMRMSNWLNVDPSQKSKGLRGGEGKCQPYWDRFSESDEYLHQEYLNFLDEYYRAIELNDIKTDDKIAEIVQDNTLSLDLKDAFIDTLVSIRNPIFQRNFRHHLIKEFDAKCAICNITDIRLLSASHIIPYSKCSNKKEMYGSNNGLLLCVQHDALFDKYLITFLENGKIRIRKDLNTKMYELLNIDLEIALDKTYLTNSRIRYLEAHNKEFFDRDM